MILLVLLGKFISFFSKLTNLGAGATWSGEIALRVDAQILRKFSNQGKQIILVAGTNGKTTTVKMIETILKNAGEKVRPNQSGANLDNGLASTFITDARLTGQLKSDYFIFEVDEATLPNILRQINSNIIVLNNLFRDQLDRYGEVDTIAEKWAGALKILPQQTKILINADDPHLAYIGSQLKATVKYFGLDDESLFLQKIQHATDTIFCPSCGQRLTFRGVYFSHLGKWKCDKCRLSHPEVSLKAADYKCVLEGVYNQYNVLAAGLVCQELSLTREQIKNGLAKFTPAFGRMENLSVAGKKVKIVLSKNPTGFNESLRTVLNSNDKGPILLALNDRIPDGRDVSWIWDVDFEVLADEKRIIVVSGDRCYDMGLRLKYAEVSVKEIYRNLKEAITHALEATRSGEVLWILPTYSTMLEIRKILTGKKIL